jgi:uncharacterized surface protein with fasciclin (FAS1) repeats
MGMKTRAFAIALATTALLATSACSKGSDKGNGAQSAQTPQAEKAAGDKTIAAGLASATKFMAAAKAAGLDQTLAGPGPYTVFVPDDSAIDRAGGLDTSPGNRAQLTGVLTNLILPGTVLSDDIGKAIDKSKGKAILATMGGGTLTATKEGGKIVLTDASGHKATVTQADEKYSNGVVHHVDALLMPAKGAAEKPAVGDKAG